jgi:hypothetical protein
VRPLPPAPRRREEPRAPSEVSEEGARRIDRLRREKRPAKLAWEAIAEPLRRGKAIRLLVIGITGKGKTHGVADFLDYVVDEDLIDLVLIHDVKLPEVQYEGKIIHEAPSVHTPEGAPEEYPARLVLRKRGLDHMPSVEGAARVTLESGYGGVRSMFVVDEFSRALTEGGKNFDSPSTRRIFCEGFGMRASIVALKQLPQNTPTDATGQSTLVYFGSNAEGANFLRDEKKVTDEMRDVIRALDVREFIFVPQEGNWDGFVYEVPKR